ncbi:hypothetical protein BDV96DRAFT_359129 [Lophiotrema nucula]|uniref:Uncharacterized protein n=1 Tax=Lophiotrema nucula TaxID=690887 RepID=A0A6A5YE88_9PLEO|nr:hypothetical protein BDV96DRAFT_359129 [Lophiotrema nucula]
MEEKTKKTLASLNTLLDMKEKHMSLSTTQSAQEQAVRSSTQGDAILIFTLVTVVFSPLSFIAAFFTINIREFPGADQDHGMPLGYVSKYLFGIGMAISILVVLLALLLNELRYVLAWGKEWQLKSWVTFSKSIWSYLWDRKKSKKPMMIQKKIPDEELGRRTASKSIDSKCLNGAVGAHLRLDVGRQSSRYRSNGRAQD